MSQSLCECVWLWVRACVCLLIRPPLLSTVWPLTRFVIAGCAPPLLCFYCYQLNVNQNGSSNSALATQRYCTYKRWTAELPLLLLLFLLGACVTMHFRARLVMCCQRKCQLKLPFVNNGLAPERCAEGRWVEQMTQVRHIHKHTYVCMYLYNMCACVCVMCVRCELYQLAEIDSFPK